MLQKQGLPPLVCVSIISVVRRNPLGQPELGLALWAPAIFLSKAALGYISGPSHLRGWKYCRDLPEIFPAETISVPRPKQLVSRMPHIADNICQKNYIPNSSAEPCNISLEARQYFLRFVGNIAERRFLASELAILLTSFARGRARTSTLAMICLGLRGTKKAGRCRELGDHGVDRRGD